MVRSLRDGLGTGTGLGCQGFFDGAGAGIDGAPHREQGLHDYIREGHHVQSDIASKLSIGLGADEKYDSPSLESLRLVLIEARRPIGIS